MVSHCSLICISLMTNGVGHLVTGLLAIVYPLWRNVSSDPLPFLLSFYLLSRVYSFWDPMDCSLPCSSVHGISQVGILEWVAISFYRGSSWPRDWIQVSCVGKWILFLFFSVFKYFFIGKPCIAFIYRISNHCTFTFMKTLLAFSSTKKIVPGM